MSHGMIDGIMFSLKVIHVHVVWAHECGLYIPVTPLQENVQGWKFKKMEALGDVLYGGIRPDIPGHGGEVCAGFLTPKWMVFETLISTAMMVTVGVIGWYTYTMPTTFPKERNSTTKQFLLVFLCLVFGIEVGYKICSKQVLYLLNPCHVITAIEVCLIRAR